MPFLASASSAGRPGRPTLRVSGDTTFDLVDPLWWSPPASATGLLLPDDPDVVPDAAQPDRLLVEVRPGETDLASVPQVLWGLVSSYGRHTMPALLHDQRSLAAETGTGLPEPAYDYRRRADDVFLAALRDVGVDTFRAWTFWSGVVVGRYWEFRRVRLVVLLLAGLALSLALYGGFALVLTGAGSRWLGVALVVAPGLVAAAVRYEDLWRFLLTAAWVVVPVLPVLVLGYLVLLWIRQVPWVLQALAHVLSAGRVPHPGPVPPVRPSVR